MEGKDFIKVTHDPLSVEDITKMVTSPTSGAISLFIGKNTAGFQT